MAVKTIQIADKPTLDATKALLEDSEVGLAAIKQAASSGAASSPAGGLHVEKAINISPSMDINVSTLPYDFYNGSAVVFDGKIHIMGGKEYKCEKKHYEYDGSSWTELEEMSYDFYYGSAVVWNNEIHILGAYDGSSSCWHCIYNPKTLSWSRAQGSFPDSLVGNSTVVYNNKIHLLGGGGAPTRHMQYDMPYWSQVSTLPYEFKYGSAVVWNNEIHILGGENEKTKHYKYDGSSWSQVSTLPYDFYRGSAVVWNNEIHILGFPEYPHKHYKYDGSSWIETSAIPYEFKYGSAVVWNNELHIMGSSISTYGAKHYSVKGDAHYVAVMLPKGTHILLPDNEEITYINNAVMITNNIAEVSETGCVEILAKYLEPGNIKDFLTFY